MTPDTIRLAIRSLALRPQARADLNAERSAGKRGGPHRSQVGHEHTQATRAHGALRADELAAAEARTSAGTVGKHRERLLALLGELEHGAPSKPTTAAPANAGNEVVSDEPLTICKQCGEHLQKPSPSGLCGFCIAENDAH
jgi:hypothetical protein